MNWFICLAGVLYVGATVQAMLEGNWRIAGVSVAYAATNFLLMNVK